MAELKKKRTVTTRMTKEQVKVANDWAADNIIILWDKVPEVVVNAAAKDGVTFKTSFVYVLRKNFPRSMATSAKAKAISNNTNKSLISQMKELVNKAEQEPDTDIAAIEHKVDRLTDMVMKIAKEFDIEV